MANELKRISVNAIERVIKAAGEQEDIQFNWHGEEITVKRRLRIAEMMAFVQAVVDNSFADDGSYMPEVEGFLRRCAILELYGNFRLPQDVEKRYDFVYSDVMEEAANMILSRIDHDQYAEILDAIQDRIDYRVNTDMEKANREVRELVRSLSDMEETFKGMFGDLSQDDMKNLLGALAQGVDEEKIVNAYMDRKDQQNKQEEAPGDGVIIEFAAPISEKEADADSNGQTEAQETVEDTET